MSKHHFKFKEVFIFGWDKTYQHAWFIFLTFVITSIIMSATRVSSLLATVVVLMTALSLASISLMVVRNHNFSFIDLINPLLSQRRVLKFFALAGFYVLPVLLLAFTTAMLVVGVRQGSTSITVFGIVLTLICLIPSIFVLVRFKFFPFVVAEHEHSTVKDLILMTYKLTEGNFWPILGFVCLAALLNLFGLLLFCIGLLVTVPVTLFAFAHLYDKLKHHEA